MMLEKNICGAETYMFKKIFAETYMFKKYVCGDVYVYKKVFAKEHFSYTPSRKIMVRPL